MAPMKTFGHRQMYRCRPKCKLNGCGFVSILQPAVIYYTNVFLLLLPQGGSYSIYNVHVFPVLFYPRVSLSSAIILHGHIGHTKIPLHLLVHHLSFPLRQSVSHPFCFLGVLYDSLYITPNALFACSLRQFVCHPLVLFTCLYYIMSAIPFCFLDVLYDSLYIIPNALFACSLRQSISTCPIRFKFYMMHITFYCNVSFSSYFTLFHL